MIRVSTSSSRTDSSLSDMRGLESSTSFRVRLLNNLKDRIIRQGDRFDMRLSNFVQDSEKSSCSSSGEDVILSFKVLLTEPVIQGCISNRNSTLLIVQSDSRDDEPVEEKVTSDSRGEKLMIDDWRSQHDDDDDDDDDEELEIDQDFFLTDSILDKSSIDQDEDLLSGRNSRSKSLLISKSSQLVIGLPIQTFRPLGQIPKSLRGKSNDDFHGEEEEEDDDDEYQCVIRTSDLCKIGARNGDFLKISGLGDEGQDNGRLFRVFADDQMFKEDNHPVIKHFKKNLYDDSTIILLLPPLSLYNLIGTISNRDSSSSFLNESVPLSIVEELKDLSSLYHLIPRNLLRVRTIDQNYLLSRRSSSSSFSFLPTIKSLTIARISSPQTLMRSYENISLRGLKNHFENRKRYLRLGDLIAVGIDESLIRFNRVESLGSGIKTESFEALDGIDELDLDKLFYNSRKNPTLPIYFKVTQLELDHHTPNNHRPESLNSTIDDYEDYLFSIGGGIVDKRFTKLIQTGLEYGFVPDVKSWIRIKSVTPLPPRSSSRLIGSSSSGSLIDLEEKLYDYLSVVKKKDFKNYGLNLSILLSGQRGTGKRTILKKVSDSIGYHLMEVNCFDLLAETDVKTGINLRVSFERALSSTPCIFLLNHLDGLARKSQTIENGQEPVLISLLKDCIDRANRSWSSTLTLSSSKSDFVFPLVIVGTTTDIDQLPQSLVGLFKIQLKFSSPSEDERLMILKELTNDDNLSPDLDLKSVALESAGLVASDLVQLVSSARSASISRILNSDRGKDEDRKRDGRLEDQLIFSGIQLMNKDFEKALFKARSEYSDSIGAPKIPKVSWEDIGGLMDVKEKILETVQLPIQHPELFSNGLKKRSGLLLYGPPGTGKTLLAKAVATSCGLNFFSVKGPELLNMYIGESEANVRRVFERARGARPCVIFFDELDSVAPKRGNQGDSGGVMDRIVSQLLAELDGISNSDDSSRSTDSSNNEGEVIVIGATNRPDLLDPALLRPGRFDKMIYLGIAETREEKYQILKSLTRKFKFESDFSLDWLVDRLSSPVATTSSSSRDRCEDDEEVMQKDERGGVEMVKNFTGADYYAICSEALMRCIGRKIEKIETRSNQAQEKAGRVSDVKIFDENKEEEEEEEEEDVRVGKVDFISALREIVPSISFNELKHYNTIRQRFNGNDQPSKTKDQGVKMKSDERLDHIKTHGSSKKTHDDINNNSTKASSLKGKGKGKLKIDDDT
ncbi:P-loop containing nucleoside triphosphate hydrolase protein [Phakopsora pachyrhizi]|nr:P-loop containing nucleoside triphosphate hydrolase protein [Phakopsora pachyrhizi]